MTERDRRNDQEQREALGSNERYRMVMVGGRVKAASISLGCLYEAAAPLIEAPDNADAAFTASKRFAQLKYKPPASFFDAHFPQDQSAMKATFRSGVGIYRPTIKTDQGPAGNVGYFTIDSRGPAQLQGTIVKEEGVAVIEEHLRKRIISEPPDDIAGIRAQIALVKHFYQQHKRHDDYNYRLALQSIGRFRELCAASGVETTRRAGVGRSEFFFFRPVETDRPIVVGPDLSEAISQRVEEVVSKVEARAWVAKDLVRRGMDIILARVAAREATTEPRVIPAGQLYFQPDVLVRADGSFEIERINMPDLGMFLTYEGDDILFTQPSIQTLVPNETLGKIRDINIRIKHEVLDVISRNVGSDVVLLTKDETTIYDEDTLEQLELRVAQDGLMERGKNVKIEGLRNVGALPNDSSVLLFNVSTNAPGYNSLLHRVAIGELQCYPDPFVKLFEKDATTLKKATIHGRILRKFLETIRPTHLDRPTRVLAKFRAIDEALSRGGIDTDIIYFDIPDHSEAYIPTFRYDPKSFFVIHKAVYEAETKRGRERQDMPASASEYPITATAVPFKPEDAVLYGPDGPRLAVFRFMFVKK